LIKTIIVDDDPDTIEILQYFISQLNDFEVIGTYQTSDDLINAVLNGNPNLILLDIDLPGMSGIEAIKEALQIDKEIKFIFITGYDSYAVEAFTLSAIDYIKKPIDRSRLFQGLNKAIKELGEDKDNVKKKLAVKFNGTTFLIPLSEIIFIEKSGKKSLIYTHTQMYETYDGISNIFNNLTSDFFQSHRSYIVNINHISHIIPMNETFIIHFNQSEEYAHLSKLKVHELQRRLREISY
jgi:two-component system, LytTR family, response regulator